jgi:hypothetical protein
LTEIFISKWGIPRKSEKRREATETTARNLLVYDGHDYDEVRRVIDFVAADADRRKGYRTLWQVREDYDNLLAQAASQPTSQAEPSFSPASSSSSTSTPASELRSIFGEHASSGRQSWGNGLSLDELLSQHRERQRKAAG